MTNPLLTKREFEEWLDANRDSPVSHMFHDLVAHYEAALKTQEPTLFWGDGDDELAKCNITNVITNLWENDECKFGDVLIIQRAARLPSLMVRVIPDPENPEWADYEVLEGASKT